MNTATPAVPADLDDPALRDADIAIVLDRLAVGGRLDPAVAERVRARAERVTAAVQRAHGPLTDAAFQALLDDES